MTDAEFNFSLNKTVRMWGAIAVREFLKSQRKYKMHEGELSRSFRVKITNDAAGKPSRIQMEFLYHGRFVDMGVGKGVKLENVNGNREVWVAAGRKKGTGKNLRHPKKWYSPVMYREFQRLSEILAKRYAIQVSNIIELKNVDGGSGRADRYEVKL